MNQLGLTFLLINQMYKIIKSKTQIPVCTKGVKLGIYETKNINETIGHVNKNIQYKINLMNG